MKKTAYHDDTIRNVILLAGMFLIGLVMLVFPAETDLALIILAGAALIILGGTQLFTYFKKKENIAPFSPGALSTGLTLVFLGVFILLNRAVMNSVLNKVLAFVLIFAGFSSLQTALSLKKLKAEKWYFSLIIAFVSVVCGAVVLIANFGESALMVFMGIAFCVESILLAVNLVLFYKLMKKEAQVSAAPMPPPAAPPQIVNPPKADAPQIVTPQQDTK